MITYFAHNERRITGRSPYSEITHFVADHKYVVAYAGKKELVLDETLKEIQSNHDDLVRIHRSTLVKADQIKRIISVSGTHDYFAVLSGGQQLRISRRSITSVRAVVNDGRYRDSDGWAEANYSLGVINMPPGYILTKKGRMYRWTHPDSGLVSAANRDKWVVYRNAKAAFKSVGEGEK